MPLVRTEAVILKTTDYSETSKVCRAFTLEHGLQSVIAKGIRRPGNKLSGVLEILNHVDMIYYKKRNRTLFTLSQATIIETFSGLASDIRRYYRASALGEMALRLGMEEESNERIFHLLTHALRALSKRPLHTLGDRTLSYIWGILTLLGYAPTLDRCVYCGGSASRGAGISFSVKEGGLICPRCADDSGSGISFRLSERMLKVISTGPVGGLVGLTDREEEILLGLTEEYVNYHVHDRKPLACWNFLRSLRRTGQVDRHKV